MPPHRPLAVRFHEKYVVNSATGCWDWIACTTRAHLGYGNIGTGGGKSAPAHRVSWELHKGPIPFGMCVLHSCDNSICVNPEHLFLGTQKDNILDARRKDRIRLPRAVVEKIKERRLAGERLWKIAKEFDTSEATVSCIARGLRYNEGTYWGTDDRNDLTP